MHKSPVSLQFLDVFKDPNLAEEYGVQMVAARIFDDLSGREVYRHEGFIAKADLLKQWKELKLDLTGSAIGRQEAEEAAYPPARRAEKSLKLLYACLRI